MALQEAYREVASCLAPPDAPEDGVVALHARLGERVAGLDSLAHTDPKAQQRLCRRCGLAGQRAHLGHRGQCGAAAAATLHAARQPGRAIDLGNWLPRCFTGSV